MSTMYNLLHIPLCTVMLILIFNSTAYCHAHSFTFYILFFISYFSFILSYVYFPCVVFSIFALSMERTRLSFHCWLYSLCIVVYVTNKTWNLKLETTSIKVNDLQIWSSSAASVSVTRPHIWIHSMLIWWMKHVFTVFVCFSDGKSTSSSISGSELLFYVFVNMITWSWKGLIWGQNTFWNVWCLKAGVYEIKSSVEERKLRENGLKCSL